jgi:hypothetical protein
MSTRVDQEVLPSVFESWVNRLMWVIKHEGTYYVKSKKKQETFPQDWQKRGRIGAFGLPSK